MLSKVPAFPAVMLAVMGLFQLAAAFAAFVPSFVHDRVPQQFIPVWRFLLRPLFGSQPDEGVVKALALVSQFIIGITEAVIAIVLLAAAFSSAHRPALANLGLGLSAALYGAFMLTMFAMHDKSLPNWNQYPAILAWIGVTWAVVNLTPRAASSAR